MVQGGDITKGDGTGGTSIYNEGGEFGDENLEWRKIDKEGLVCMANRGPGTNTSQFFITLAPCDHLNGKHTVFGMLVGGGNVLESLAKVEVDQKDRPKVEVLIERCGELERKKRATATVSAVKEKGRDDRETGRRQRSEIRRGRYRSRSLSASNTGNNLSRPRKRSARGERISSRSRSPRQEHHRKHHQHHHHHHDARDRRRQSLDGTYRGRTPRRSTSPLEANMGEVEGRKNQPRSRSLSKESKRKVEGRDRENGPRRYRSRSREWGRYGGREERMDRRAGNDHRNGWKGRERRYGWRADEEALRMQEQEREGGEERWRGVLGEEEENARLGGWGPATNSGASDTKMVFKGRGVMKFRG